MTNTAGALFQVIRYDGNTMQPRPVHRGVYRDPGKAWKRRHHERAVTPRGSSDWITVERI